MNNPKDYWFHPTPRINGFIYIKDGEGRFVTINHKLKKFKTVTKAAQFIYKLEYARNVKLREEKKLLEKGE